MHSFELEKIGILWFIQLSAPCKINWENQLQKANHGEREKRLPSLCLPSTILLRTVMLTKNFKSPGESQSLELLDCCSMVLPTCASVCMNLQHSIWWKNK